MAARKKKLKARPRRGGDAMPDENRGGEAFTVFWMLTLIATLGAELSALAAWGLSAAAGEAEDFPVTLRLLPGWLLAVALITGLLCLLLTPLAYRIRTTPPPLGVTVIAAIVGASPLVVLLLISSLGR